MTAKLRAYPIPVVIPSGSKRREALARVLMLTHYLETIQEEQAGAARLSVSSTPVFGESAAAPMLQQPKRGEDA